MRELLTREPVAVAALVRIAGLLGARYGLDLSPEELLGVAVLAETLISAATRQRVSPVQPPTP